MKNIKVGDIYTWSFTEAYRAKNKDSVQAGTLYWILDQIAVAVEDENGKIVLHDTYKYDKYKETDEIFSIENLRQCSNLNLDIIEIDSLNGNQKDYLLANKHSVGIYNESDILELRIQHGYSTVYLLKVGAIPCVHTQIDKLRKEVHNLEHDIRSAKGDRNRALGQIALLEGASHGQLSL